jgi:hypothetical protein
MKSPDIADSRKMTDFEELTRQTEERLEQGLAPPAEIYRVQHRRHVDWSRIPSWARPVDPEAFLCHEG